ncbi:unnamed protein product [Brachionus calyciflorus]|uniref:Uncharacterized protein n=1 Tax=Brachionus calyciflorus TaxID=104777 RepID=A0A814QA79_9BILA|nr:unnamed protein product [Brachionus calyciflorus]
MQQAARHYGNNVKLIVVIMLKKRIECKLIPNETNTMILIRGLDKLEIPYFPDGYLLNIGFSTLQELCKTIQLIIEQNLNQYLNSQNDISLKRFRFTQEHSVLNLNNQRDSFVTCICKSALPFNYTQYVLNLKLLGESGNYRSEQADKQSQIVAVILYSELLGSSRYILLNTLQHLTSTLGLKPMIESNGALKHINCSPVQNDTSMIFTAVQTDIAFICNLLTNLFESTRLISDQALENVIYSLLKLSIECSDQSSGLENLTQVKHDSSLTRVTFS